MEPLDIERNLRALQGIYPGEIQDKPHPLPVEHIKGIPIWMRENIHILEVRTQGEGEAIGVFESLSNAEIGLKSRAEPSYRISLISITKKMKWFPGVSSKKRPGIPRVCYDVSVKTPTYNIYRNKLKTSPAYYTPIN